MERVRIEEKIQVFSIENLDFLLNADTLNVALVRPKIAFSAIFQRFLILKKIVFSRVHTTL